MSSSTVAALTLAVTTLPAFAASEVAGAPPVPESPPQACALEGAHLHARLHGALDEEIDWSASQMGCDGMLRAAGGFRVRFDGPSRSGTLVLVFGVPSIERGRSGKAVPVNVTLIAPGGTVYGTLGPDRCVLDELDQEPASADDAPARSRVSARGFCLEPARAIGSGGSILLTTFEFTGLIDWGPEPAPAP